MGLLDRYILRTVVTPLVLALCVAAMLLMIEQMLRLFDFVLAEQGPVDVVWRMLANLVPHYLSLALPLGAFLGVMLAFRNLSMSSELDAMNSSGASIARLLRPVFGLLLVLAAFDFLLVGYIKPYARYEYDKIRFDVTSGALGIKIPQGEFIEISDKATIRLGSVDTLSRQAKDIFLEMREADGRRTIITAQSGGISTTPDITSLLLRMAKGRQLFVDAEGERLQSLDFESFDLELALPAIARFRPRGDAAREATFTEILRALKNSDALTPQQRNDYRAQLHWTILHPLTFLVLPVLAVAMGVAGRRKPSNLKPVLGVAMLIAYHEMLEEWGLVTASLGQLSPFISMWGLLVLFIGISIWLYRGSIDRARTAKVMARGDEDTVRLPAAPGPAGDSALRRGMAQ
ncbi:MAG: LptF/LptG family permease [Parvularculaceae bacterium]|nr:LptF/LptG family permease [Parvularculaceae bacterium]